MHGWFIFKLQLFIRLNVKIFHSKFHHFQLEDVLLASCFVGCFKRRKRKFQQFLTFWFLSSFDPQIEYVVSDKCIASYNDHSPRVCGAFPEPFNNTDCANKCKDTTGSCCYNTCAFEFAEYYKNGSFKPENIHKYFNLSSSNSTDFVEKWTPVVEKSVEACQKLGKTPKYLIQVKIINLSNQWHPRMSTRRFVWSTGRFHARLQCASFPTSRGAWCVWISWIFHLLYGIPLRTAKKSSNSSKHKTHAEGTSTEQWSWRATIGNITMAARHRTRRLLKNHNLLFTTKNKNQLDHS